MINISHFSPHDIRMLLKKFYSKKKNIYIFFLIENQYYGNRIIITVYKWAILR